MTTWSPVRRSAMHHSHLALGASMVERDGWQQPARYSSVEEELRHLKDGVALHDISPSTKLLLQGNDMDLLLAKTFSSAEGLTMGEVRRVASTNGSDAAPVLLARLALDQFLALAPEYQASSLAAALDDQADRCVHMVDLTSGLAGVGITGPDAGSLLAKITELDISESTFGDMHCAQAKAAEVHGTLMRLDLAGLPGYQLYFSRDFGQYMWGALMEAGTQYRVAPAGFEAMERLLADQSR